MPDKIEVRNGSWKIGDIIYVCMPALVLLIIDFKKENTVLIVAGFIVFGGLLIYFGYHLLKRFADNSVKIEFSDFGIVMPEEEERIPWSTISKVDIFRGNGGLLDFVDQYISITVETKSDLDIKTFDITDYKVNKHEILEYCGRKIDQHFDKENNSYTGEDDDEDDA